MLEQQAQDLEDTMQQLVQKGRELHAQQQKAASLQTQTPGSAGQGSSRPGALEALAEAQVRGPAHLNSNAPDAKITAPASLLDLH